jgi:hypothetical protein
MVILDRVWEFMNGRKPNQQLIDDLKATKARVQRGWCGTGPNDDYGNVCLLLAAGEAVGWHIDDVIFQGALVSARAAAITEALKLHLSPEFEYLDQFNDHPRTTQSDIENLIDKALADLGGMA